jgi:hypothetical protein
MKTLDTHTGFRQAEEAAIAKLLGEVFGTSLPGSSRVTIEREMPQERIVVSTVAVDGQMVGTLIGTWFEIPEADATAFAFASSRKGGL